MPRFALLLLLLIIAPVSGPRTSARAEADCTVTLQSGDDITQAASRGRVVCLGPGVYRPFVIDRSSMPDLTIRGADTASTTIQTTSSQDIVVYGAPQVTLSNFTVKGPKGIYVARSESVTLDRLWVDGAAIAVHIDDNSSASLTRITLTNSGEVGLLVRNNATVRGSAVQVMDSTLVGVAATANAHSLTLRDSEVGRAAGPGIFAGISGCAELGAATLEISTCFYSDLGYYLSQTNVVLDRVSVHDGPGTGIVFFPGVTAEVRSVDVSRWGYTGLFAWGSDVRIASSTFDENLENAIEYRAFPDPRKNVIAKARGSIEDTIIRRTKPLHGLLGGGIVAQSAQLSLGRDTVDANTAFGVLFDNGSSGEITGSQITGNGWTGVCITTGNTVEVRDTQITGNAGNDAYGCG